MNSLIRLEDVEKLTCKEIESLYNKHIFSGIPVQKKALGMSDAIAVEAEGMTIKLDDGRTLQDYSAGFSILNAGHNHQSILSARKKFRQAKHMEVWKTFLSPYLAALSKAMADISPPGMDYSFFCNSGSEANEGALKLAEKYHGNKKKHIIYADNALHGKTHGSLSVSGGHYKDEFIKLNECISIPFGDADAFEAVIQQHMSGNETDVLAIILEAVDSRSVIVPPKGYLKSIEKLCKAHDILLIIDEVTTGFGRTGKMFAFEHEQIVPDIFTIGKALGGGKASIGAYVTSSRVFLKAYGKFSDALIHSTTFNGMGEECCTALEAINLIVDEDLPERSARNGIYFLEALKRLQGKFPNLIMDVRGIGLLLTIEFPKTSDIVSGPTGPPSPIDTQFDGYFTGYVTERLLKRHNILVMPSSHQKSCMRISPPLNISTGKIDHFIASLERILETGPDNIHREYHNYDLH